MNAERFCKIWVDLGEDDAWARGLFDEIHAHYATPGRHYHTPAHIKHCLNRLDKIAHLLDDPTAAELAIWFHDVIYEIGSGDNERRSAQYFLDVTRGRLDNGRRARIARHILATIYPSSPTDPDSLFIVDIDLSSFCLPWPQFLRDSANVRRESSASSDAEYARKQQAFLTRLAGSPPFFRSAHYLQHHEQQAQSNICRILALLSERERAGPPNTS